MTFTSMAGMTGEQETGLLMAEVPRRVEQDGLPTALLWHPLLGSDFEDRLVRVAVPFLQKNTRRRELRHYRGRTIPVVRSRRMASHVLRRPRSHDDVMGGSLGLRRHGNNLHALTHQAHPPLLQGDVEGVSFLKARCQATLSLWCRRTHTFPRGAGDREQRVQAQAVER